MTVDQGKELREIAWGLQNRISGRGGISSITSAIPDDLKRRIQKMTNEAIALCTDNEGGYIAPDDWEEGARRYFHDLHAVDKVLDKMKSDSEDQQKSRRVTGKVAVNSEEGKKREHDDHERSAIQDTMTPQESAPVVTPSDQWEEIRTRISNSLSIPQSSINLSSLDISDSDIPEVLNLISSLEFNSLDLSNNRIAERGAQMVAAGLAVKKTWKFLSLSGNKLGAVGRATVQGLALLRKDASIDFD